MSVKVRSWKYAAVIALICTGVVAATAVGVKIHKWRVVGKHSEDGYLLQSQSEDGRTTMTTNVPESWADNPEQAVEVKEELDLQKQQGKGELESVVETEVNGMLQSRSLIFKNTLADGREIKTSDHDPKYSGSNLTRAQKEEVMNLLKEMKFEELDSEEKEVMGRVFVFKDRMRFILSDGTEVIKSVGRLKDE